MCVCVCCVCVSVCVCVVCCVCCVVCVCVSMFVFRLPHREKEKEREIHPHPYPHTHTHTHTYAGWKLLMLWQRKKRWVATVAQRQSGQCHSALWYPGCQRPYHVPADRLDQGQKTRCLRWCISTLEWPAGTEASKGGKEKKRIERQRCANTHHVQSENASK